MRRPSLDLAVAINRSVRHDDEWFDEPDDLDRLQKALDATASIDDPISAAAILAYRVARAQAFGEANKRTAFVLAKWVLDRNGVDGADVLDPRDRRFPALLVKAAAGLDVENGPRRAGWAHGVAHRN